MVFRTFFCLGKDPCLFSKDNSVGYSKVMLPLKQINTLIIYGGTYSRTYRHKVLSLILLMLS
jgi:hypothetical protein